MAEATGGNGSWKINPSRVAEGILIVLGAAAVLGIWVMREDVITIKASMPPITASQSALTDRMSKVEGRTDENTVQIDRERIRLDCLTGSIARTLCAPNDRPLHR